MNFTSAIKLLWGTYYGGFKNVYTHLWTLGIRHWSL